MNTQQLKVDGYSSFSGGMDSSRGPSVIDKNQYVYAVNCIIPKSDDGVATRKGFRPIHIDFRTKKEEEIFKTGNPQGCGWYKSKKGNIIIIYVIDGYFFELTGPRFRKKSRILNLGDQNDPNQRHVFVSQVPNGVIINDGYDAPFYISDYETRRTRPSKREIDAGLMGVYVQNRFWYVKPDRKEIFASTIKQPISLDEAIIDNIYGISVPEDDQEICAIGKQGTSGLDAVGGNLAFATARDFYSADVRGARTNWGVVGGRNSGFVKNTVPGVGAISHTSFAQFNGNIFYRNPVFGLVSLNQALSDYNNKDAVALQTIEASLFFESDYKKLLDSCYTIKYKKSVLTTVTPKHRNGFVYWNGILVKTPDPYYGKQAQDNKYIDIVESVFTGLRPWNIQSIGDVEETLMVLSYDYDQTTRLYAYDESIDHDICGNKIIPIESKLLTKSFDFSQQILQKSLISQTISFSNITRDTRFTLYSRPKDSGNFQFVTDLTFNVFNRLGFTPYPHESRDNVNIPSINELFFVTQDLIVWTGSATLRRLIKESDISTLDRTMYEEKSLKYTKPNCIPEKVYTYRLCQ